MRFLVDESTGRSVAEFLRQQGHDVVAASDCLPSAPDQALLALAQAEGRIIVSNDKDFGELIFRQGGKCPGVVLFRLKDETAANRVRVAGAVLQQCGDQLPDRFVVANDTDIRIRPMP